MIHPDLPRFFNSGYVFTLGDTTVFHPGDALTVPEQQVDILCVPVCAPWMRAAEGIDFAACTGAPRNVAIHDRIYSEAGLRIVDGQYGLLLPNAELYPPCRRRRPRLRTLCHGEAGAERPQGAPQPACGQGPSQGAQRR